MYVIALNFNVVWTSVWITQDAQCSSCSLYIVQFRDTGGNRTYIVLTEASLRVLLTVV